MSDFDGVYRTWTPRVFALVIWSAIIPFFLLVAFSEDAVRDWPPQVFMAVFLSPFVLTIAASRLTGVSRGEVRIETDGLWWRTAGGEAAPAIPFGGIDSWSWVVSLYGKFVPLLGEKNPLIIRFDYVNGEKRVLTLVFRSAEKMHSFVESIDSALESFAQTQGAVDGKNLGTRRRNWMETGWRPVAGVGLIFTGIALIGVAAYFALVLGRSRGIHWAIGGFLAIVSGIRLIRA